MVMKNSLPYQNKKSDSIELFDKIAKFKRSFFPKSEVDRYANIGAVTYTKIIGNKYEIRSNTDKRSVTIILK